jgi:hypothetical protein
LDKVGKEARFTVEEGVDRDLKDLSRAWEFDRATYRLL